MEPLRQIRANDGQRRRAGRAAEPGEDGRLAALVARVEALEAQKAAVESFVAVAAHELIGPLVMTEARVAMASDQLEGNGHAAVVDELHAVGRHVARSRHLVEALLDEARTSGSPLELVPVALDEIAADSVRMLAPEIEARGARIDVEPLPRVSGQPDLLRSLVTNLLVNALKFSRRSGSSVTMSASGSRGSWTIFVDDEAQPIPPEDRERIFLPFARGRGERRVRGAGLGLAICQRIVERHGGRIGVTDAVGGGNRFFFTLPRASPGGALPRA
jgi:signal transduction histidine kinase